MAPEIGSARCCDPALAASRTTRICSVAYATEDRASDDRIGRASTFGRCVCPSRWVGWARPTRNRFRSVPNPTWVLSRGTWAIGGDSMTHSPTRSGLQADVRGDLLEALDGHLEELVQVQAEDLRGLGDFVAVHAGGEGLLLELLLDRRDFHARRSLGADQGGSHTQA